MYVITMEMWKVENNAQSLGISHNLSPISANSGLNQNFQIWAAERFCEMLCTIHSLEVCNIVVQHSHQNKVASETNFLCSLHL